MHILRKGLLILILFIAGALCMAQPAFAAPKEDKKALSFDCVSKAGVPIYSICIDHTESASKSGEKDLFSYTLELNATAASKKAPKVTPNPEKQPMLNALLLFNMVNDYRKKINLPEFKTDENLCKIAESRLPELQEEIWGWKGMHKGFYERPISQTATENIISFDNEEDALNWWLNSSIHLQAIQGTYQYSCVACIGNNCTQIFTNTPPKKYVAS